MTGCRSSLAALLAVVSAPSVVLWSAGFTPNHRTPAAPAPVAAAGLHNVFRVSPRLYSGSGPDSDQGFASLRAIGVKTVLSVDGAAPDVAAARAHGLRYVHVPVGYDGIPRGAAWAIAKAVRDLPGPVYVHCHHGKHRGPAAAACAALALDPRFTPAAAGAWLRQAGTDPKYTGLVSLPRTFPRPTPRDLHAVPDSFPEVAAVPDLVRLMVAIDERWDHLQAAQSAGRATPPGHPDVDPRHEAVQLTELFREAARLPDTAGRGVDYFDLMKEAEAACARLEGALSTPPNPGAAGSAFKSLQTSCSRCHVRYRD